MFVRHQRTLETCCVSLSILNQFVYIVLIEHFELSLAFVYLDAALVLCIICVVFIEYCWFPVFEEMSNHAHIIVLLCCGLACLTFELGSFNEPWSIPLWHPCHPVEWSQLEMSIDVPDIYFCFPTLFLRVDSGRLIDRVWFFEPVACIKTRLPILTLGL